MSARRSRAAPPWNRIPWLACCGWLALACASPEARAACGRVANGQIHPEEWAEGTPALGLDAAVERRLDELLHDMTLEQKVGQLIQADIGSITPEDIRQFPLGSILNGGDSSPGNQEFAPPSRWLRLADRFYAASLDPSHGGRPLPVLWGTDAVHGLGGVLGATIFPQNIGLGAARDPQLIRSIGEVTAREIRAVGLDWTFSPTVAVARDVRWGRTYESYSSDPQLVRQLATQMVLGLQGSPGSAQFLGPAHVIATAKHFLGDGGTAGKDQGDNLATEAELRDIHLAGYSGALAAGVQTVMTSLSSWHGTKLHGHRGLLTDVLKYRLHFDGFVLGDWNGHAQVPGCSLSSCGPAINAGIDVLMAPADWKALYVNTLQQVKSGEISLERLDDAVGRVIRVKIRAHLLDEGSPSSRPFAGRFELLGAPAHRALARRAVRESLVLLKNEHRLLPLAPHQHVLVAGDAADDIGVQSGGWTLGWQGVTGDRQHFPHGESIYHGIRAAVARGGGTTELSPTGAFTKRPDVAIVVFGERPYAEFHGDIATLRLQPDHGSGVGVIRELRAQGIAVVAVLISGRPLFMNAELNAADAFVAAWLPGSEGGGIADVLFKSPRGRVHDFTGRLSFPWPAAALVSGTDLAAPLFDLGFGLTYRDEGQVTSFHETAGSTRESAGSGGALFVAGRTQQGLHWFFRDDGQVHVLPKGLGTSSSGRVRASAVDRAVQEDARRLLWNGSGPAAIGLAADTSLDLQDQAQRGEAFAFDFRTEGATTGLPSGGATTVLPSEGEPSGTILLEMECGVDCRGTIPLRSTLAAAPLGEWHHASIPLACFARSGVDLRHVTIPFELASSGAVTLSVTNIEIIATSAASQLCPQ